MLQPMNTSMDDTEASDPETRDLRRVLMVDGLLALAIGAVTAAPSLAYPTEYIVEDGSTIVIDSTTSWSAPSRWAAVVVVLIVVAPLVVRRLVPRLSFAAVLLASVAMALPPVIEVSNGASLSFGLINLPLLVAMFSLAHLVDRRPAVAIGVIGAAGLASTVLLPVGWLVEAEASWYVLLDTFVYAVMPAALVVLVAQLLRDQRLRADAAQREAAMAMVHAELRVAEAASAERRRLAAELHDIVAHHVNLMVVQSEKGPYLQDREASDRTYATIGETGRAALAELDRLLGVLRTDGSGSTGAPTKAPLPTHHEVPAIVDAAAKAGVRVELRTFEVPAVVEPAISATVHRIVQECITNVVKHGDHGRPAAVSVTTDGSSITIAVSNVARAGHTGQAGRRGHGLESMRSRVEAFGGTLHTDDSGEEFRVEARIPLAARPAARIPAPVTA